MTALRPAAEVPGGADLLVERAGGVTTLTMGPPGSEVVLSDHLVEALHAALDQAEADPACRVVVLRGGCGVFCTGMDLEGAASEGAAAPSPVRAGPGHRPAERFYDLLARLTTVGVVVVSMVDGRATGGGVGLVAASDFALATPRSQFALPEALWGLLPYCVLPFVARRTGFRTAYAMALSTMPLAGPQALDVDLVDQVEDDPEVPLRRLLARVLKVAPAAVGELKRYAAGLAPGTAEARATAVDGIERLTSSPAFVATIDRYVRLGLYPWDAG